ncbi:alpha/beta fold hydrolase [Thalassobacillus sp. CUG 92003]|uniref:alpha/beta fold hydrolase n=1 Tax=Thalassobacillus sp. CUG 92003 TaxID=2736641 RepID=UPI0015E69A79|nr:alpha/beta hydrolase [Thalassobacillus sp. CUG 92003]
MPYAAIEEDVQLYYEDEGEGDVIIFIHGVWMSSRFFKYQIPYFQSNYRTIALDLRGHGCSSHPDDGHTVATYAQDLHAFIRTLNLENVTLAGWSMGAFVIWEYLHQFGEDNVAATVIVDELASDFKWDDFEMGAFDLPSLTSMMRAIQTDQNGFLTSFIPLMFKYELEDEDLDWMLKETTALPESIASAILFDQSVVDCRPYLPDIKAPTLLCFGRDEKLIPVAAGEYLLEHIPHAQLEIFEESCHCPFIEETEKFNTVVDSFLHSLK